MLRIRSEDVRERLRPATAEEQRRLKEDLRELARPRRAGSEEAREVDATLRERFTEAGYEIRELPFEYSAWPGRYGLAVAGIVQALGAGVAAGLLLAGLAAGGLIAVAATLILLALVLALGYGAVQWLPWGRAEGRNWLVQRAGAAPRYLLVAHRDTKSQPISTLVRNGAIVAALAGDLLLLLLGLVALVVPEVLWLPLVLLAGLLALAGGVLLALCHAGNESPGALDNASGLATLLGLARRLRDEQDVAFLLTDAEELGLAGARAVTSELPPLTGLINFDGLDDHGAFYLIERHGWPKPRGIAPHLAATLLAAADAMDEPIQRRHLPLGILVDHVAFVRAGLPAVTLMRGSRTSLRRVHRSTDTAERLSGDGVARAITLVDTALMLLRLPPPPRERILPDTLVGPRERTEGS